MPTPTKQFLDVKVVVVAMNHKRMLNNKQDTNKIKISVKRTFCRIENAALAVQVYRQTRKRHDWRDRSLQRAWPAKIQSLIF